VGKQCDREGGKSVSERRFIHFFFIFFSFFFLLTLSFIYLCFCLGYLSHCCSCNHIVYVIRQFQLDSFDMYYLYLCANSNLRSSYYFLSIFFLSWDISSHAVTHLYSFVVVHRCRFASSHFDQVNEWVFLLPLMYLFQKPSVNRHTHKQIENEVCCCLLYLISFEHFKTINSFFVLNTIIYVVVWQISVFFFFKQVKKRKGNHNPIERKREKER